MKNLRRKSRRGGSAFEMALLMPWYVYFFVGALDWGFFSHALISTASAARTVALYASTDANHTATTTTNTTNTCNLALEELRFANNDGSGLTTCTALPVILSYSAVTGTDGQPATSVTLQYQTLKMIPIPGLLGNQFTFQRTVQVRLRG